MRDPHNHQSRGFGFITFQRDDSAKHVLQNRYHDMLGKRVEVKSAVPAARLPLLNEAPLAARRVMATVSQEADLDKEAQAVDMVTASKRTPAVTILGESTLVLAIRAAWVEFRPLTVELRRTTMDTTKRPLGLLVKTRLPAVVLVLLHTVGLSTLRQKVRNASSTLSRDLSWKCTALSLPVPSYFTAESRSQECCLSSLP